MEIVSENVFYRFLIFIFVCSLFSCSGESNRIDLDNYDLSIDSLRFSPDGKTLALLGENGTIFLWDLRTKRLARKLTSPCTVNTFFVDNAKSWLAMATLSNGRIEKWCCDVDGKWESTDSCPVPAMCDCVALAPGKKMLAISRANIVTLCCCRDEQAKSLGSVKVPGKCNTMVFSADGEKLLVGGKNGIISLFRATNEKLLLETTFIGHTGAVNALQFNPVGNYFASGGDDTTVRVWNLDRAIQQAIFQGHDDRVISVAFAPDGKTLASSALDKSVQFWNADKIPYEQKRRPSDLNATFTVLAIVAIVYWSLAIAFLLWKRPPPERLPSALLTTLSLYLLLLAAAALCV